MSAQEIRDAVHAQPFVPFRMRMPDGRTYEVRHPEFLMAPPGTRGVAFFDTARKTIRVLDALHIEQLEYDQPDEPEQKSVPAADAA